VKITNLKKENNELIYELAKLHKLSLKNTVATSLSTKNLAKLYELLINIDYLNVIVAINENNNIKFDASMLSSGIYVVHYYDHDSSIKLPFTICH